MSEAIAKRRGRPALPPNLKRSDVIRIRFTPDESDRLYQAALRRGFHDLADAVRHCCWRLIRDESSKSFL